MRTTHIIFQIAKREVFRIATRPLSGAFSTLTMVPSFALILCEFG
jgi:hypothetical protein